MQPQEEQIARKCIHFNGVMEKVCKAGINYADVRVGKPYQFPCLQQGGECSIAQFMTPEQIKKELDEIERISTKALVAMIAVKDHYAKTKEQTGKVPCECGGQLHYTVAQINGHVWAKCNSCDISFNE